MDLWAKVIMFERLASKKIEASEVITAQKEAKVAADKARKMMDAYMKGKNE